MGAHFLVEDAEAQREGGVDLGLGFGDADAEVAGPQFLEVALAVAAGQADRAEGAGAVEGHGAVPGGGAGGRGVAFSSVRAFRADRCGAGVAGVGAGGTGRGRWAAASGLRPNSSSR